MQTRLKTVSKLVICSKLKPIAWIAGLLSAIFNSDGRYFCNTHLNGLNIEIQCVSTLFETPFVSMISLI
jgi:hypothetical protein